MSSMFDGLRTRPCVGCGYCCTEGPCGIAINYYGSEWLSPCPALVEKAGRKWCKMVLQASGQKQRDCMEDLAIGAGCSSTMFNEMRDKQIAKGK